MNVRPAIRPGGLESGATSDSMTLVFSNPGLEQFAIAPEVRVGGPNQAPVFEPVGTLTVMPGDRLEIPLVATDADGDRVTFLPAIDGEMPTGTLEGNGKLIFTPTPDEIGTYTFDLIATDGGAEVRQTVTVEVVPDPVTTTRVSGTVLDVDGSPLVGVPIQLGFTQTVTDAEGKFTLELSDTDQPTDSFNIAIPEGDVFFDPFASGDREISLRRTRFDPTTGDAPGDPLRHPNLVTSFLDGSVLYGSDDSRAEALRLNDGSGQLKNSPELSLSSGPSLK